MSAHLSRLPLILPFAAVSALAMFVPAGHAHALGDHAVARTFLYAGQLGMFLIAGIALAIFGGRPRGPSNVECLASLVLAYAALPLMLAVPFREAAGEMTFLDAYFEMVSCLTTTGATLFESGEVHASLHLWRGLVGWLGGLLAWTAAAAILAPLRLGGFEITERSDSGPVGAEVPGERVGSAAAWVFAAALRLAPVYSGLTLALWVALAISGDSPLVALVHAMSTLSTSGISPVGGLADSESGVAGELAVGAFMAFALSRLAFSSDAAGPGRRGLAGDPEFRTGALVVAAVALVLFARQWAGALESGQGGDLAAAAQALRHSAFTAMSFLTTTGFEAAPANWSGLEAPEIVLVGLALVGGGVATTAGGAKLLRIHVVYLHGRDEMERLVRPSLVGGAGGSGNRIPRGRGAVAWIFFMLFALSLALTAVTLAGFGLDFEDALVAAAAGLSTAGPLIPAVTQLDLGALGAGPKIVLAAAMLLGRLETLAMIALFNPSLWRR